ncbi:MAG: penicillin-binding protein 2 [bacterium]|nr:penicillin-binding protein 2 [bacterium]
MKELNVEDLLFNEEQQESDYLERPLSRRTFLLVGAVVVALALIAFGRSAYLNVARGSFYQERALVNLHREVELPAPRGIIKDRFGNPLVENKNSFSAFLNVADLLKKNEDWSAMIGEIAHVLGSDSEELEEFVRKANLEKRNFIPLARNISRSQTISLNSLNFPEIEITSDYVREYIDGPVYSHTLGYVGESDSSKDLVGKDGIEAYYDSILRGIDGKMFIYRDALGKTLDRKVAEAPRAGGDLVVTLDSQLQKFFYDRMKSALAGLGREAGVGIALDPQSGEVLAMVSLPSFDNNNVSKYLVGRSQPLFNRAVSGTYTPGSTIKPLVALAALHEKIVEPDFQILSTGSIEIPNPYVPENPSRFLDWKAHGWVDLRSALARSSNVYFYELGGGFQGFKGLGIERLRGYWEKFLLGQKTGIDLLSESSGFLPEPEEKEKRTGQIWRIGDTYNVSIGQGDLQLTPLQLINFISSIANNGKIFRPHLVNKQNDPEVLFDYSDWASELKEVRQGMEDAVSKPYGTANMLVYLPMKSAGKTGSSQVANNTRTNAFFVGYAPAENSEIAVLVLIENSREGSLNAVPVARDVMQWYYDNRISNGKSSL